MQIVLAAKAGEDVHEYQGFYVKLCMDLCQSLCSKSAITRVGSGWRLKHEGRHIILEEEHLRSLTRVGGAPPLQVLEGSAGWRHPQAPFVLQVRCILRLRWWQGWSLYPLNREERFGGAPSLQTHVKGMCMIFLIKFDDFVIMQSRVASLMYLKAGRHKGEVLDEALA